MIVQTEQYWTKQFINADKAVCLLLLQEWIVLCIVILGIMANEAFKSDVNYMETRMDVSELIAQLKQTNVNGDPLALHLNV